MLCFGSLISEYHDDSKIVLCIRYTEMFSLEQQQFGKPHCKTQKKEKKK